MKKTLIAFALGASLFAGSSMAVKQPTSSQINQLVGKIEAACGAGATCPVTIQVKFPNLSKAKAFEADLKQEGVPASQYSLNSTNYTITFVPYGNVAPLLLTN